MVTLPWAAKVLFQDAIYWIERCPDHPWSRFANTVLPAGYITYARSCRALIFEPKGQVVSRGAETNSPNCTVVDALTELRLDIKNDLRCMDKSLNKNLMTTVDSALTLTAENFHRSLSSTAPPPFPPTPKDDVVPQPLQLHRIPVIPSFGSELPKDILTLVHAHIDLNLDRFKACKTKSELGNATRLAYSKRQYIFTQVKSKATSSSTADVTRAAVDMDNARLQLGLSVAQYYNYLKEHDVSTRKRVRCN